MMGGNNRSQTVAALAKILPELKKAGLSICNGFGIVTL